MPHSKAEPCPAPDNPYIVLRIPHSGAIRADAVQILAQAVPFTGRSPALPLPSATARAECEQEG